MTLCKRHMSYCPQVPLNMDIGTGFIGVELKQDFSPYLRRSIWNAVSGTRYLERSTRELVISRRPLTTSRAATTSSSKLFFKITTRIRDW